MAIRFIIISMIFALAACATTTLRSTPKIPDNTPEESDIYGGVAFAHPDFGHYGPYGPVPAPNPHASVGLTTGKETAIASKLDLIYLLESLLNLLGGIISNLQFAFQNNYDLIRSTFNAVVGKISFFYVVLLRGIEIIRSIFYLISGKLANVSFQWPSFGAGSGFVAEPHPVYGVPGPNHIEPHHVYGVPPA